MAIEKRSFYSQLNLFYVGPLWPERLVGMIYAVDGLPTVRLSIQLSLIRERLPCGGKIFVAGRGALDSFTTPVSRILPTHSALTPKETCSYDTMNYRPVVWRGTYFGFFAGWDTGRAPVSSAYPSPALACTTVVRCLCASARSEDTRPTAMVF